MFISYIKIAVVLLVVTIALFAIDETFAIIACVVFYGGIGIGFLGKLVEQPIGYRTNPKNTPEQIKRKAMLQELEIMQSEFDMEMRNRK